MYMITHLQYVNCNWQYSPPLLRMKGPCLPSILTLYLIMNRERSYNVNVYHIYTVKRCVSRSIIVGQALFQYTSCGGESHLPASAVSSERTLGEPSTAWGWSEQLHIYGNAPHVSEWGTITPQCGKEPTAANQLKYTVDRYPKTLESSRCFVKLLRKCRADMWENTLYFNEHTPLKWEPIWMHPNYKV